MPSNSFLSLPQCVVQGVGYGGATVGRGWGIVKNA